MNELVREIDQIKQLKNMTKLETIKNEIDNLSEVSGRLYNNRTIVHSALNDVCKNAQNTLQSSMQQEATTNNLKNQETLLRDILDNQRRS